MSLLEYQVKGVMWMMGREKSRPSGGFLCDEMGLGKTVQMISLMLVHRVPKTLIIVPNSLVDQWMSEIHKFSRLSVGTVEHGTDNEVTITTYSKFVQACRMLGRLQETAWDRIILDEGHEIRTAKSKRYKAICTLQARTRWVLSGTPIYNRNADYTSLLNWIRADDSHVPRRDDILLRRTKASVGLDIPPCHFENVELEMYPEEWNTYCAWFTMFQGVNLDGMMMLEALLRVRQLSIHPSIADSSYTGGSHKMDRLVEDIQTHPSEKSIIFSQFHREMDIIQERLAGYTRTFRLDGRVPQHERAAIIQAFNECGDSPAPVFIIQVKTGGQGLNLQQATRVYITAPSWNPATELQAIARAHRKGQTQVVRVKKYIYTASDETANSVEEAIVELQGHKSVISADVLNDPSILHQLPKIRRAGMAQTVRRIFHIEKKNIGTE